MADIRTIVRNAYRKAGITALSVTPNAVQMSTGVALLSQIYTDLVFLGTLGQFRDVYTTVNCTADEFERVTQTPNTLTVTLPATIHDCVTRKLRAPHDMAVIVKIGLTPGTPATNMVAYIYDAAAGAWEAVTDAFNLTDYAPLSAAHKTDLEALLAGLLADERGIPLGPILSYQLKTARQHFATRDAQRRDPAVGDYM